MPNYRRWYDPGGTWFFGANLADRKSRLLVDEVRALRHAIFRVKRKRPFRIDALVVLPDHLHAILTLPPGDTDFSTRWRLIRTFFSRSQPIVEWRSATREARGERDIWQRRFWEHRIRDERDYAAHVAYCYINPVKHGLAAAARDWPHSTLNRDIRAGLAEPDWSLAELPIQFGERGDANP